MSADPITPAATPVGSVTGDQGIWCHSPGVEPVAAGGRLWIADRYELGERVGKMTGTAQEPEVGQVFAGPPDVIYLRARAAAENADPTIPAPDRITGALSKSPLGLVVAPGESVPNLHLDRFTKIVGHISTVFRVDLARVAHRLRLGLATQSTVGGCWSVRGEAAVAVRALAHAGGGRLGTSLRLPGHTKLIGAAL
jgi:hypothetical protein